MRTLLILNKHEHETFAPDGELLGLGSDVKVRVPAQIDRRDKMGKRWTIDRYVHEDPLPGHPYVLNLRVSGQEVHMRITQLSCGSVGINGASECQIMSLLGASSQVSLFLKSGFIHL